MRTKNRTRHKYFMSALIVCVFSVGAIWWSSSSSENQEFRSLDMASGLKLQSADSISVETDSTLLRERDLPIALENHVNHNSDHSESGVSNKIEKFHEHHEGCLESMRIGAKMNTEPLAQMSPEEAFSRMLSDPRSEALYIEFEETVLLPNGETVRRSDLSLEFERALSDLPDDDASPSSEI